jgi:hypothetical protein
MADKQELQSVLDAAKVSGDEKQQRAVKSQVWQAFAASKDSTDLMSKIGQLKLEPSVVQKLQQLKSAPPLTLSPNAQLTGPPQPTQPRRSFTKDMSITPKEVAGIAVNAIPDVGGAAGGMLGAAGTAITGPGSVGGEVAGAAAGGAVGEGIKDWLVSKIGPQNLSGPTYKTEPPPGGGWDTVGDIALEGVKQGGGQLILGGASKIIRGALGGPMHQAVNDSANKFIKAANDEYGLKLTAPEVAGKKSPGWALTQRLGSYNYFAQEVARRSRELGAENAVNAIDETIMNLTKSPTPAIHSTPTSTGKTWQGLVDMSRTIFKAQSNQQYEDMAKEAAGVPITVTGAKNEAKKILGEYGISIGPKGVVQHAGATKAYPEIGGPGAATLKILQDIAKGPDQVPFEVAKTLRSNLLAVTPQSEELMAGKAQGVAKDMVKHIHQAIGDSLTINKPSALPLWEQANKFYKDGMELLNNDIITGLMDAGHPEILADAIKSGKDQETMARAIRNAVLDQPMAHGSPAEKQAADMGWRHFQEQFIRSNVIGIPEGQGDLAAESILKDPSGMYNRLREIGPGVRDAIFGSGNEGRKAFDNIQRVAEAMSRIQKLPVESRQFMNEAIRMGVSSVLAGGAAAAEYSGNVGAMGAGAIAGAVGFEAVPLMITKALHSEAGSKYLADGIGGLVSSIEKAGVDKLGKGMIQLQNKTINAPAVSKVFGPAIANIGRAWKVFSDDQENIASTAHETALSLDPLANPYKR